MGRAVAMGWDQWIIVASFVAAPLVLVILWLADVIRPGSLSRRSARDVRGQPAAIWFFAAAVTFFAALAGALVLTAIPGLKMGDGSSLRDKALFVATGYVASGAAGFALAWLISSTPGGARAGLTARWKDAPTGLGALLLVTPVLIALMALAPAAAEWITGDEPDRIAHEGLKLIVGPLDDPWRLLLISCAVVGAPIVEEIIYRGFLQSAFVRVCDSAGVNRWLGVLVTSAIFAGVHYGSVPVHGLVVLAVLGVCFGAAFERTGRLGVPIVMHALFNAANIVVAFGR